jgi:hypothetical protein
MTRLRADPALHGLVYQIGAFGNVSGVPRRDQRELLEWAGASIGDAWCLGGQLVGPSDGSFFDYVMVGGYVRSGAFTPMAQVHAKLSIRKTTPCTRPLTESP